MNTELLSEQSLVDVESRHKLASRVFQPYKEVSDSLSDIPALCQTVRALRKERDDAMSLLENSIIIENQNIALREQLRQQRRTITDWQNHIKRMGSLLKCSAIDGDIEVAVKELQSRLAQVEKERDDAIRDAAVARRKL